MNYACLRNPPELVARVFPERRAEAGAARVASRLEERRFLDALHKPGGPELRELFLIVGGFMDGVRGHAYSIRRHCPEEVFSRCDVFYRQHPEDAGMRELVRLYAERGKKVILVGHSWGADALVSGVVGKTGAPVALLATLDPVSRKAVPQAPLPGVRRWINVRLDYSRATWLDYTNVVARIGRPWGHVSAAAVEVVCGEDLRHASAARMFSRHVLDEVLRALE